MKWLFALCLSFVFWIDPAEASLKETFQSLDHQRKGPFTVNYLQGTRNRRIVTDGSPSGTFLFQAAFRNEVAQKLVRDYDFYVGNLFTTNYYELIGEFVYGDANGSHDLNHAGLYANAAVARPKALSMTRHWVLETHYVDHFRHSKLSRSFRIRGISGSEFEQVYASHFLNFYLSVMNDEFHFLPAVLLAKGSPIANSSSLEKARALIAEEYDRFRARYGANDQRALRMYELRNAIHNQLSESVIGRIDAYFRDFPFYQREGNRALGRIREILVAYYSVNIQKVIELAKKAGAIDVQARAEALQKSGSNPDSLHDLALSIAQLRQSLTHVSRIPPEKKTGHLLVLLTGSQFINREIAKMKTITSKKVLSSLIHLTYAEGFLIEDNWRYFLDETNSARDVSNASALLPDLVGIASDTLEEIFEPAYSQWRTVEPKMNSFIDQTIKSSSLNTVASVAKKIKK